MVTFPKASSALWMTAAPSVTLDVFATARPPALVVRQRFSCIIIKSECPRTFLDSVNNGVGSLFVKVIDYDVGASAGE